jgi:PAS domain S-box-containing protein
MNRSASLGVLLEHAQDKIVLLDEDGRVTYANEATERILGWEPDRFVDQNAFEFVHPEDVEAARAAFERTIEADSFTETTVELRHEAADGSWVRLESRMSNLTDERLDGYVVSSRDVTDRVEAQRERRETARRLEEIAASTGDVLWMFDADWSETLFVNPAYEEIYGRPVEELEASPEAFLDAIHPEDVPAVREAMDCLSAGESVDMEYRVNPDRDYRMWVWAQAEPIVEDDEVVRITGFSRDVTDRYRRERQLYVMDNLLRHNLRNDVNVILGNARLVEDEAPEVADRTAVIRRTGEDLLASADKEREIINLLTDRVRPETVDLGCAVADGVRTVRERYPAARIGVAAPGGVAVRALAEIRLAVVELLENAITHTAGDEPTARVAVESAGDRVVLTVSDDAPPIPEMEARVLTGDHEMNDVYHSTGLGLWLVYWIVELSGGEVEVESDPGGGNRVQLVLPRRR